jgi:hypothetical protein
MEIFLLILIVVWVFCGLVAALIALKKGEEANPAFQAFVLGPIGLWVAILYAGPPSP